MRLPATLCLFLLLISEQCSCTNIQVTPGSSLDLTCFTPPAHFSEAPVTWEFNGEDIRNLTSQLLGTLRAKKNGLTLSISPVTTASSGKYECIFKEKYMEISKTYTIQVLNDNVYNIKIHEGQSAYLPCQLQGTGQVTTDALWFRESSEGEWKLLNLKDNSADGENRIEQIFPHDQDQTIVIRDTVMLDTGIYHCMSNGLTLSTVNILIEVAPTDVPNSCSGLTTPWEPCLDENSRTAEPILQESMVQFSMQLYSHFSQSQPSSNLLFSPISIAGALSHLLLGASGDTRKAIERATFVPHDFACVHFQMKKLREKLDSSLQMASQIYYNAQLNLSQSFIDQSTDFYEAEPTKLLETDEKNTDMINRWVANKTNNKITHFVNSVSPETRLLLLNAVSFSGQWKVKFDRKPRKGLFTKFNGDLVKVPLLHHHFYMLAVMFHLELESQVARFPLSDESSLYIVLPRSHTADGLQQVEQRMTDTVVLQMMAKMKTISPDEVEVTLPQIKLDVEPNLIILFKKLGLSSIFEDPKLCGLSSEERFVLSDARHKAFLALNEHGVEAGAVTSMSFSRSFREFSALRPFIMLLWSDRANVPLFIGRVTDP